jgi:hypothetical protein
MLMKRAKGAAKTAFPKLSIKRLKDMPLEEYTKLLARNMVETLNTRTKRPNAASVPKRSKCK